MDQTQHELLEALRKAIAAEYEGYGFYLMAARTTEDPLGRDVFQALAQEELHHAAYLKSQFQSISATGQVATGLPLGSPQAVQSGHPIFSPALKERIGDAHFEMSALGVGIHLEQNAMEFYRTVAGEARDSAVRAFFRALAEWEAGHYNALLAQQQELQGDYWAKNGFAPF